MLMSGMTEKQCVVGGNNMNWISVKDRLPENEQTVLAYYNFGGKCKIRFYGTLTYYAFDPEPHWQHEGTGLKVTHWMPLPEPPEEEENE